MIRCHDCRDQSSRELPARMMSARRWVRQPKAGMFLLIAGGLLALPILLPLAMIGHLRSQLRLRKLVGQFLCVACGAKLGINALRIADQRWAEEVRRIQAVSPRAKIVRMIRRLHAVCPGCGCEYTYLEKRHTLVKTSDIATEIWKNA